MKIATLTIHLPFNYGNALQMLSLHRYLREQGYDAEVLSCWFRENQDEVWHWHNFISKSFGNKVRFLAYCCTWTGKFCQYRRESKLRVWREKMIRWSSQTGCMANFPSKSLPHDVVIVGSDQVWNPVSFMPFYFLGDFPDSIRKIAYGASLGGDAFPAEKVDFYRSHLQRFSSISMREGSAVRILSDRFGLASTLVADPTLLHTREEWCQMLGIRRLKSPARYNMLYSVTPDGEIHWRKIARLARSTRCKLHVYAYHGTDIAVKLHRPFAVTLKTIAKRIILFVSGVRLHFTATPTEFVQRLANCNGLFTDSFHGLMFATIFERKCNVQIGAHGQRKQMAARLRDFISDYGFPGVLTEEYSPEALTPVSITPRLSQLVSDSKAWLRKALEGSA